MSQSLWKERERRLDDGKDDRMKLEKRVVGLVAAILLVLSVAVCGIFLGIPDLHVWAQQKHLQYATQVEKGESVLSLMQAETAVLKEGQQDIEMQGQLRLEIPEEVKTADVGIEQNFVEQEVRIYIPEISQSYFYDYPMIGSSDHIDDIKYDVENKKGLIDILLDDVYITDVTWQDHYLYMDFVAPRDRYDKIVVIDAGHGGSDPGAEVLGTEEKDIDLAIAKKILPYFQDQDKIGIFYTRTDDSSLSLEKRVGLANTLQADLFLSIHNNTTASGRMSGINGTEVMYHAADESGASKAFAQTCLDQLLQTLGSGSKGVVVGDDIYIIRTAQMPVALAEIGFMTNQEELDKLKSDEYQEAAAKALAQAVLQTLEE